MKDLEKIKHKTPVSIKRKKVKKFFYIQSKFNSRRNLKLRRLLNFNDEYVTHSSFIIHH